MKCCFDSKQKLLKHCEAPSKGSKGQCQWGKGKLPGKEPQPDEIKRKKTTKKIDFFIFRLLFFFIFLKSCSIFLDLKNSF